VLFWRSLAFADVAQEDFSQRLNEMPEGWLQAMGITITKATADEVRAEMTVGPEHLQGYGIVHGGIYAIAVEGVASAGACAAVADRGMYAVGAFSVLVTPYSQRLGDLVAGARLIAITDSTVTLAQPSGPLVLRLPSAALRRAP